MTDDPYAEINAIRKSKNLTPIRRMSGGYVYATTAITRAPIQRTPARSSSTPARVPATPRAASRARSEPVVWIRCGLSGAAGIQGFGFPASVEGWTESAVRSAADRLTTGCLPFHVSHNHAEVLDDMGSGRIAVRHINGDVLVRWRPGPRGQHVVEELRRRGRLPASVEICGGATSTCQGDVRLITRADLRGVAVLTSSQPAYWQASAVLGGISGSIDCLATAMKYFVLCSTEAVAT
jgi:hypothetical protein